MGRRRGLKELLLLFGQPEWRDRHNWTDEVHFFIERERSAMIWRRSRKIIRCTVVRTDELFAVYREPAFGDYVYRSRHCDAERKKPSHTGQET